MSDHGALFSFFPALGGLWDRPCDRLASENEKEGRSMGAYYTNMSPARLRDLLDELEERLFDLEEEEPEAYRRRMEMENLINNSRKYAKTTVAVLLTRSEDMVSIHFRDTGSGIPPEFIDSIFNTYASQDAEQQKGYGLGLALCKIIVEKLGGNIRVESTVNVGSTFTFRLPFEGTVGGINQEHTTTTTNVRTIRVSARPEGMNQKTILVAEDEDSNYELVKIVLQKRFRLIRAHNGIEAVNLNEDERPDLILMDIRMPEMNGLDATRIIKEINHDTPVIALSAYAFEENIREAKMAGCDEFMAKPFRVENLIEIVKRYLHED